VRPDDYRPPDRDHSHFGWRVFVALPDPGLSVGPERLVLSRQRLLERERSGATEFRSEFFLTAVPPLLEIKAIANRAPAEWESNVQALLALIFE
jgi:hypothetical protein